MQVTLSGEDDRPRNPLGVTQILDAVRRLDQPPGVHAAVTITGGEPLLHPDAVHAIAVGVRALALRVHVETGGHRPGAVRHVLDVVDEVSPDLKLESATGARTPWDAHAETYRMLEDAGKALAVKAVVGATTPPEEVEEAAAFAAEHLPSAPLVLQPAHTVRRRTRRPQRVAALPPAGRSGTPPRGRPGDPPGPSDAPDPLKSPTET